MGMLLRQHMRDNRAASYTPEQVGAAPVSEVPVEVEKPTEVKPKGKKKDVAAAEV